MLTCKASSLECLLICAEDVSNDCQAACTAAEAMTEISDFPVHWSRASPPDVHLVFHRMTGRSVPVIAVTRTHILVE